MIVTLTWKKRTPKRNRPVVLSFVRHFYPHAKDTGEGIQMRTRKPDTKPVWIFLVWNCFAGME